MNMRYPHHQQDWKKKKDNKHTEIQLFCSHSHYLAHKQKKHLAEELIIILKENGVIETRTTWSALLLFGDVGESFGGREK